jgi:Competence-damaged protein
MTDLSALARRALEMAGEKNLSIVTAESCTAGKLAALLYGSAGCGRAPARQLRHLYQGEQDPWRAVVLTCKLFCSRDRVNAGGLLTVAIVAARLL